VNHGREIMPYQLRRTKTGRLYFKRAEVEDFFQGSTLVKEYETLEEVCMGIIIALNHQVAEQAEIPLDKKSCKL
jgi:hypothetical protein